MELANRNIKNLKKFLDQKVEEYNCPHFIKDDPISIPHLFSKKQDIEIIGFIAAMLAWGQRKTIIKKCNELIRYMDHAPYQFITQHTEKDLEKIKGFKHRTFNETDMLYFIHFFKSYYSQYSSLEIAFAEKTKSETTIEKGLIHFHHLFFSLDFQRKQMDWLTALELTTNLKKMNSMDPVKYDFALFGLGVEKEF